MDEQDCRDCVLARIVAERKIYFESKFDRISESIAVAKIEMDRRLEGMNEFRSQLEKQSREFITKREVELTLDKLAIKLEQIEKAINQRAGGKQWSDHIITSLITLAAFLVAHYVWKF